MIRARSGGDVPVSVSRLAEGVLNAMFLTRLSAAAAVLIVVATLAAGATALAWPAAGQPAAVETKANKSPESNSVGPSAGHRKPKPAMESRSP